MIYTSQKCICLFVLLSQALKTYPETLLQRLRDWLIYLPVRLLMHHCICIKATLHMRAAKAYACALSVRRATPTHQEGVALTEPMLPIRLLITSIGAFVHTMETGTSLHFWEPRYVVFSTVKI